MNDVEKKITYRENECSKNQKMWLMKVIYKNHKDNVIQKNLHLLVYW